MTAATTLTYSIVVVFAIGVAGSVAALLWAPPDSALPIVTAVLASGASLIAALLPLLLQISKTQQVQVQETAKLAEKIEVVHIATNSMHDAVVSAVAAANLAEGRAEGIASERANPQVAASALGEDVLNQEAEDIRGHRRTT